jgi:hypothetical protein
MSKTITFCSWSLVVVGVAMTSYFYLPSNFINLSTTLVVVWTFVPYLLFCFAICAARSSIARAVVLATLLFSVGYGFEVYFDSRFIHISTIDFSPIVIPFVQSLIAGVSWLGVRWYRAKQEKINNANKPSGNGL